MDEFGKTVSRNALQYFVITGCDATSFFQINEKINPFKEVLQKSSCLGLIECLRKNESLSNADVDDFLTFIQTLHYGRAIYESCVITRKTIL